MDYGLLGSSVNGILQARIPEWVAIPFSRGYSRPRNRTRISCIAGRLYCLSPRATPCYPSNLDFRSRYVIDLLYDFGQVCFLLEASICTCVFKKKKKEGKVIGPSENSLVSFTCSFPEVPSHPQLPLGISGSEDSFEKRRRREIRGPGSACQQE